MIHYHSRAGRLIRSILGGIIGGGMVTLAIMRADAQDTAAPSPDGSALAKACEGRDGWTDPAPPAHVFGNTWYVGTCGITVLLVASPEGHVLIDGGPAEAAPLVEANIEKLGFKMHDVKWIVSSHEHEDHVGALAALQRLTGAKVAAVESAATALAAGRPGEADPQRAIAKDFAPVRVDRVLRDGERLDLGALSLAVRATPAHAPGSASWTWSSCEGDECRTMAYADSATMVSAKGYRFGDHPDRVAAVRIGLSRIDALPCDILMTPHPGASKLFERLAGTAALEDASACRRYAAAAGAAFDARLASGQ